MKFSPEFFQALSRQNIVKYLVEDEVIMNWNILKKSILILCLGAAIHVVWIAWKIMVLAIPQLNQWVNVPLMHQQLIINVVFLALHLILIYPCYALKEQHWVKLLLPFLAVAVLVISLCRDGYLVGILSPATMMAYISLVAVGCVLLPRILVYSAFIPATIFLMGCVYLTYIDILPYGNLFTIAEPVYLHGFWLLSMLFFISPIMFTCFVLFEILLSQWRHREKLIQHLSQIDPLTNVLNRRSINSSLETLDAIQHKPYCIVLIDLDHFKQINDQYGHDKGDEALVRVGKILQAHVRETDIVGRFGGEEFILLLKNSQLEQAKHIAERCRKTIEQINMSSNENTLIHITASFGLAMSESDLGPQQLISHADKALYRAKAKGRNRVECHVSLRQSH